MKINSKQHKYLLPYITEPIVLPDYTVITGLNGSGKTLFLKSINDGAIVIDNINPAEILYYSYDDFLLNASTNQKSTNREYPTIAEDSGKAELEHFLNIFSDGFDSNEEKAIIRFGRPIKEIHQSPNEDQYALYEQFKSSLPQSYLEGELDFGTRLNYVISALGGASLDFNVVDIKLAVEKYVSLTDQVSEQLKQNKYLFALYNYKKISYGLPDLFLNTIEEAEKAFQVGREKKILTDWYKSRLIEPNFNDQYREVDEDEQSPLEILNRVLKEYDLNGFVIKSNKLYGNYESRKSQKITLEISRENGYSVAPYQNLSSGEKTLLTLSYFIYTIQLNYPPKVLLLDEIDSFLHPNAVKHLIKVIQKVFVQDMNLKVILATHSLTTVALSPEGTIYAIDRSTKNLLAAIDRTNAINILSEGIAALTIEESDISISYQIKKTYLPVIFTEGVTDVIILETAWKKLHPEIKQPFELAALHGEKSIDSHLQTFLRSDGEITKSPSRHFIALFDFDAGYTTWNGDRKRFSNNYEENPYNGLTISTANKQVYKMLLPVPKITEIEEQVMSDDGTYEADSKLYLEHYFFDSLPNKFRIERRPRGGYYVFKGSKVEFAYSLNAESVDYFKHFIPLFAAIRRILSEPLI